MTCLLLGSLFTFTPLYPKFAQLAHLVNNKFRLILVHLKLGKNYLSGHCYFNYLELTSTCYYNFLPTSLFYQRLLQLTFSESRKHFHLHLINILFHLFFSAVFRFLTLQQRIAAGAELETFQLKAEKLPLLQHQSGKVSKEPPPTAAKNSRPRLKAALVLICKHSLTTQTEACAGVESDSRSGSISLLSTCNCSRRRRRRRRHLPICK